MAPFPAVCYRKFRALDAAKSGVNTVHIIDGRIEHSLLLEVLTEQAFGTMIRSH
jgi:acetylglutamate kinase